MIVSEVIHFLIQNHCLLNFLLSAPCNCKLEKLILVIGGWGIFNVEGEAVEDW